ncbi:MAG: N-acetylmuramoyl-L-alanine amidase [Roseinatronobacter sp.]|nr:N-acetylmuramoyl-L-alanine amidase [Roseinatronobacter sp.]
MQPIWHPSPNFGPRREGLRPGIIVLHYTGMHNTAAALARLCDPEAEVSAHYLISPKGQLWQLVAEEHRAWHAGAGSWQGRSDINSHSIGIELANTGAQPFPEPQMQALEALLAQIQHRWHIPARAVIAHSDMAPDRKEDPGPRFDWRRLARQGLAFWPEGFGADLPLDNSLDRIGYPPAAPEKRLQAFRFRFLPAVTGAQTLTDRRRAAAVAAQIG